MYISLNTQILPGIKAIAIADARMLMPHIALRAICDMPVPVLTDSTPVEICGEALCKCEDKKDGATHIQEASLSFHTTAPLPTAKHLAFVVTDVAGDTYLIGAAEEPYPRVSVTHTTGSTAGEPAGYDVEVSHKALRTMVPCIAVN